MDNYDTPGEKNSVVCSAICIYLRRFGGKISGMGWSVYCMYIPRKSAHVKITMNLWLLSTPLYPYVLSIESHGGILLEIKKGTKAPIRKLLYDLFINSVVQ